MECVCVGYAKELERTWCAWTRTRGVGAARERRDERCDDDATTREDATTMTRWRWMDGFVFVRSRAVMRRMDARARECVNARASAMDDRRRARAFAFDRRRWCAREDDEGETRRRTGEEIYIYIYIFACSRVARARARRVAGSKRREIDDEDDVC